MKDPKYNIPEERKTLYYLGAGLMVIGFILFISVFFTIFRGGPGSFTIGPIGFVLIIIGSVLRGIGARGLAGSGVVLDPQKAREDLEPYTRAGGGMIKDALEETGLTRPDNYEPQVKVRCRSCQALNDETAKYCNQCGEEL